jgi:hypothetical protein
MPKTIRGVVISVLFMCALTVLDTAPVVAYNSGINRQVKVETPKPAMTKKQRSTCRKASRVRQAVIKKLGQRSPGRDICRYRLRGNSTPSSHRLLSYLYTLRRLIAPPPQTVAVPGAPMDQGSTGVTSTGVTAGGTLSSIAQCESGGDPTRVDSSGIYRGKYQFDQQTWESVGGVGDPASAPEAEQDARAQALLNQSGSSPWPVCG